MVGGYRDATCMVVGGLSGRVVMREELVDGACRVEILSAAGFAHTHAHNSHTRNSQQSYRVVSCRIVSCRIDTS